GCRPGLLSVQVAVQGDASPGPRAATVTFPPSLRDSGVPPIHSKSWAREGRRKDILLSVPLGNIIAGRGTEEQSIWLPHHAAVVAIQEASEELLNRTDTEEVALLRAANRRMEVELADLRSELANIRVAKVSKGLKGTLQKALKEAAAAIQEASEELLSRTSSEEVALLRAANCRMEVSTETVVTESIPPPPTCPAPLASSAVADEGWTTGGLRLKRARTGARMLVVPGATSAPQADALAVSLRTVLKAEDVRNSFPHVKKKKKKKVRLG
ncbi:hypothetical protein K1T71_010546, partial [Dendrolimus kikuchii]